MMAVQGFLNQFFALDPFFCPCARCAYAGLLRYGGYDGGAGAV